MSNTTLTEKTIPVTTPTINTTTTLPSNGSSTSQSAPSPTTPAESTTTTDLPTSLPPSSVTNSSVTSTDDFSPLHHKQEFPAAIVGGCVGGALLLLIVIILVAIFLRRKRASPRSSQEIVVMQPPSADQLRWIEESRIEPESQSSIRNAPPAPAGIENTGYQDDTTIHMDEKPKSKPNKHYDNLTNDGKINDETNPSVGEDGYLKKQNPPKTKANVINAGKAPLTTRQASIPSDPAPPVPEVNERQDSYIIGRPGGHVINASGANSDTSKPYQNLKPDNKGPMTGISPKTPRKKHRKDTKISRDPPKPHYPPLYYNDSAIEAQQRSQSGKLYENVENTDNVKYYNTKDTGSTAQLVKEVVYDDT